MTKNIFGIILGVALFGGELHAQDVTRLDPTKQSTPEIMPPMPFKWNNMLLAWIKLDKDFEYSDRRVDSYMAIARPETWNQVRNNEFRLQKARTETLGLLKKLVEEFKVDGEFVIESAKISLGKYDFEMKSFPIDMMTGDHYWYSDSRYFDSLPRDFKVYFTNNKLFAKIKMDAEKAESLIKERTDRYGNVSRETVSTIRFHLETPKDLQNAQFYAEIRSVTVYSDKTKNKILAELTLPAKKEKE